MIPSTEAGLTFLSFHEGRTDTLLPPQTSRYSSQHRHGPAAEGLLVPQKRMAHRPWVAVLPTAAHHGYCPYYVSAHVGKPIPQLLLAFGFWWMRFF